MDVGFVTGLPLARVPALHARGSCIRRERVACRVNRIRPATKASTELVSAAPKVPAVALCSADQNSFTSEEVLGISAGVCEFMNADHVKELANFVVKFGSKFDDMSQLDAVKMTGLDASGFYIDVVSCDDSTQCVCVQEKLMWPLGLCHNVNDVMVALKHLCLVCGLPTDFL